MLAAICGGCVAHPPPVRQAPTHGRHAVTYGVRGLAIDGRPTPLWATQFHYWRLPSPDAWRNEFARMKAAGYNAVALDFFWGYHSPRPGAYDFGGVRDVGKLLTAAATEGLYIIAQPGPFIEAGADTSGLPAWLLARNARAGSVPVRYLRESRDWLAQIDAIVARHQLTNGTGSVILYDLGERAVAGRRARLERAARADGITVPFNEQVLPVTGSGTNWGWTGDPLGAYTPSDQATGAIQLAQPRPELPPLTGWRARSDDAETKPTFEDQAWPEVRTGLPLDPDDPVVPRVAHTPKTPVFLGVDDYGFHHGAVWYRGHFVASGAERVFSLRGVSGRGGAAAVWLNGASLGAVQAARDGTIAATLPLLPELLHRGAPAVLSVLFENMGHNEALDRDVARAQPRGLLTATLSGASHGIAWRILGNGEYNTDPIRGPLATGGLAGEIAGWQDPAFADASWAPATLPAAVERAGITWYRTHAALRAALDPGSAYALRVDDARPSRYRALLYVNGWLLGHYVSGPGAQRVFPIPAGILAPDAANTIAVAAWSLDGRGAIGRVSLATVAAPAVAGAALPDIPEVRAVRGVANVRLDVVAAAGGRPHFVYDGADAAPTIRVGPGDTLTIDLQNQLRPVAYTPNAVNLHFHGLNVPPAAPGDDVMQTLARPGATLHYVVHVPRTQPPGLYWYHPHAHGETYWQVTSGMAGAIVVDGLQERIPALQALRERTLVVRDVQDHPDIMRIPWYARRQTIDSPQARARGIAALMDSDDNAGPGDPCQPEVGLHLTVNGRIDPVIAIGRDERQLFRVLNASASRVLDLAIDNGRLGLVAVDGYPVASYPGNGAILSAEHLVVPPAGRVEFVAHGQAGPTVLRTRCYDSGPGGDRDPEAVIAQLQPAGAAPSAGSPSPAQSQSRRDESAAISPGPPSVRRTVRLTEDARGFYIDGRAFRMDAPPAIVARAGTLEEWTILNDTDEVHAFHVHQLHVLVESTGGTATTPRLWRDTVLVPVQRHGPRGTSPGVVKMLVDFRDPATRGTFVFHCHMLDHEDGGMMAKIQVI